MFIIRLTSKMNDDKFIINNYDKAQKSHFQLLGQRVRDDGSRI